MKPVAPMHPFALFIILNILFAVILLSFVPVPTDDYEFSIALGTSIISSLIAIFISKFDKKRHTSLGYVIFCLLFITSAFLFGEAVSIGGWNGIPYLVSSILGAIGSGAFIVSYVAAKKLLE